METMETTEMSRSTVEEAIRRDYANGLTYRELAKKYRKSPKTLVAILKGPRAVKEEAISVELKRLFNDNEKIGGRLTSLLEIGNIKEVEELVHPETEKPFTTEVAVRDLVFDMISYLKDEGWTVNRDDLKNFLAGKLDFAVIRWLRG